MDNMRLTLRKAIKIEWMADFQTNLIPFQAKSIKPKRYLEPLVWQWGCKTNYPSRVKRAKRVSQRGRNFIWFAVFPSFPLTFMQKKNFSLRMQGKSKKCLCVCLWVSAARSNNFWHVGGLQPNFQGLLNSLQVIFGPWPRKRAFLPNLSPPGLLGQGDCVTPFQNQDNEANKTLGAEFWVLAHSPWKRGWKAGLARSLSKILEFQHFL